MQQSFVFRMNFHLEDYSMRFDFCVACQGVDDLDHHHLVPRHLGGSDDETNLVTLCHVCHGKMHGVWRRPAATGGRGVGLYPQALYFDERVRLRYPSSTASRTRSKARGASIGGICVRWWNGMNVRRAAKKSRTLLLFPILASARTFSLHRTTNDCRRTDCAGGNRGSIGRCRRATGRRRRGFPAGCPCLTRR